MDRMDGMDLINPMDSKPFIIKTGPALTSSRLRPYRPFSPSYPKVRKEKKLRPEPSPMRAVLKIKLIIISNR